jgi:hypothetical protein
MILVFGGLARPRIYNRDYNGSSWTPWGFTHYVEINATLSVARKIIAIPAWNMDTASTFSIAHGINATRILGASAFILAAGATSAVNLETPNGTFTELDGSIGFNDTNVVLSRRDSPGLFDQAAYNNVTGYITIDYWVP